MVVDEGDVVAASAEGRRLSRSPYVLVDYVEEAFACGALLWEWESMLFTELTCFAHSVDSFPLEVRKFDNDSLRLSLEVDVADSHVPQLNVYLGFETLRIHGRFHLVRLEDKHSAFPSNMSDESAFSMKQPP